MFGFCGEYQCTADAKGRMFFPAKLREVFGDGESMILVRSLDPCISVYTAEKWGVYAEKIESIPPTEGREVKRFFYSSIQETEPDSQGRILLPPELREWAGVIKEVRVIGCGDHAEIWDAERYRAHTEKARTESVEDILKRNGL